MIIIYQIIKSSSLEAYLAEVKDCSHPSCFWASSLEAENGYVVSLKIGSEMAVELAALQFIDPALVDLTTSETVSVFSNFRE